MLQSSFEAALLRSCSSHEQLYRAQEYRSRSLRTVAARLDDQHQSLLFLPTLPRHQSPQQWQETVYLTVYVLFSIAGHL